MKKILVKLIIIIGFVNFVNSQNFKELIHTPYSDYCSGMLRTFDNSFIAIHSIIPYENGAYITPFEVNNYPFTSIFKYNNKGELTKELSLQNTDSTIYLTSHISKLPDNRIVIAGGLFNINTEIYNIYFAIFTEQMNDFDLVKVIKTTYNQHPDGFTVNNDGNLVMNTGYNLQEYSLDGNLVRSTSLTNTNTCSSVFSRSVFYFNNKICLKCNFPNDNNHLILDSLFNQQKDTLNSFSELNGAYLSHYAFAGKELENDYIFPAQVSTNNSSFIHPVIMSLDSNMETSVFFADTLTNIKGVNYSKGYNFDFVDKNHIYTMLQRENDFQRSFVLYSINGKGEINWKKFITLDSDSDLEVHLEQSSFCSTLATEDKGCIFTYLVKDNNDNTDVYYLKIDSMGNSSDFETGIFSYDAGIQLNDFLLYPNSFQSILNVETSLKGFYILSIYNNNGQKINSYNIKNSSKINLEEFLNTNYFYTIQNTKQDVIQSGKLIKSN